MSPIQMVASQQRDVREEITEYNIDIVLES